eukprot:4378811-Pyramimonas_sp.AAC.1
MFRAFLGEVGNLNGKQLAALLLDLKIMRQRLAVQINGHGCYGGISIYHRAVGGRDVHHDAVPQAQGPGSATWSSSRGRWWQAAPKELNWLKFAHIQSSSASTPRYRSRCSPPT